MRDRRPLAALSIAAVDTASILMFAQKSPVLQSPCLQPLASSSLALSPLPSAIIFDCDGTLADTMPVHYEAWSATLARYPGLELSEDRFYVLGGWPTLNIAELLKKETGLDFDPVKLSREKELEFEQRLDHVQPIAPVVALVHQHRGKLPIAVATGGIRRICETILHAHRPDRLVRRNGLRRGGGPSQAGAGHLPRSGPPARHRRRAMPRLRRHRSRASRRRGGRTCNGSTSARSTRRGGSVGSRQTAVGSRRRSACASLPPAVCLLPTVPRPSRARRRRCGRFASSAGPVRSTGRGCSRRRTG